VNYKFVTFNLDAKRRDSEFVFLPKWRSQPHNHTFSPCNFDFDAMISEESSIPESVADFIEGRTSKKIGQAIKHAKKFWNHSNGPVGI
jgi:hypothetical protein